GGDRRREPPQPPRGGERAERRDPDEELRREHLAEGRERGDRRQGGEGERPRGRPPRRQRRRRRERDQQQGEGRGGERARGGMEEPVGAVAVDVLGRGGEAERVGGVERDGGEALDLDRAVEVVGDGVPRPLRRERDPGGAERDERHGERERPARGGAPLPAPEQPGERDDGDEQRERLRHRARAGEREAGRGPTGEQRRERAE